MASNCEKLLAIAIYSIDLNLSIMIFSKLRLPYLSKVRESRNHGRKT